mmetsp:Transcript_99352/g.281366  ORF Transcript_99352/g.281366 Transcript_99352/m.281366 type:complete len:500 (+) Transcript_99352:59-1558(+)
MAHMTPVGAPEDFSALDGRNGKEESMQSFVHDHMVQMMQPMHENLRRLQQQLEHFSKDLVLTDMKANEANAKGEQHDHEILQLRNSDSQATSLINQANTKITKEVEDREKLETKFAASQQAQAKANERQQHTMASIEGVDRRLAHLDSNFMSLKSFVAKSDEFLKAHLKDYDELRARHDDLHTRHEIVGRKLQQTYDLREAGERDLQALMRLNQHQQEEHNVIVGDVVGHLKRLQKGHDASNIFAEKQATDLQLTQDRLQQVKDALDHKDGVSSTLVSLESKDAEIAGGLAKAIERLDKLDKALERLMGDGISSGGGGDSKGSQSNINETVEELVLKMEIVLADVSKLANAQQKHGLDLKDTAMLADKLQRDQKRMKDKTDRTDLEVATLGTSHDRASSKFDSHAVNHNRLLSDVQTIDNNVTQNLHEVRNDLGTTSASLSKLRSNYDAANRNIHGLTKGFQDANKLTGRGSPLPAIASPRGRTTPRVADLSSRPLPYA